MENTAIIDDILENVFRPYEAMQLTHLQSLENEKMPDIHKYIYERDKAFSDLQNSLKSIMESLGRSKDPNALKLMHACRERITALLKTDEELTEKIKAFQDLLKNKLTNMKKGKNALTGYGRLNAPKTPQFLSQDG